MSRFEIAPFILAEAGVDELMGWYTLNMAIRLEMIPDEPVFSMEELVQQCKALGENREVLSWVARGGNGETVGLCSMRSSREEHPDWPVYAEVSILPAFRRKGLGKRFAAVLWKKALERGWDSILIQTTDRCTAGGLFASRLGAVPEHTSRWNRLELADVDLRRIKAWLLLPSPEPEGFQVGSWTTFVPHRLMKAYIRFSQSVYDEKRNEPGFLEYRFTPERTRRLEEESRAGGRRGFTVYAMDGKGGDLLGLSSVNWFPGRPSVIYQGFTAVHPESRGLGIAKRLKAEVFERVTRTIPEARFIRAGNADGNLEINGLNSSLGFRCLFTAQTWKASVASLGKYLSDSPEFPN